MNVKLAPPVGYYKLDLGVETNFHFVSYKRPSYLKRFMMKHLLGFIWMEY